MRPRTTERQDTVPQRTRRSVRPDAPTLDDVGRRAGVSGAAASYVLTGRATGQVGAEAAERVRVAAAELGYRPNRAARALRSRRNGIIGLVLGQVPHTPPAVAAMAGAHEEARAHDHSLLVTNAPATRAGLRGALDELLDRQVDAVVVAVAGTRRLPTPDATTHPPLVLANALPSPADATVPCVLPDEEGGGRAATEHVLAQGHRRIAFLAGVERMWATAARVRGHRAALAEAGVPADDTVLRYGTYRIGSGHALAREVLARRPRPTALLCGNDRMALGALIAAGELGLRVPHDLSIMGYDDEPELAAESVPALSTVHLPYEEMGRRAVRLLVRDEEEAARILLPCRLVARGSVSPPPDTRRRRS